jgi:ubiquinone/menaquinone biosynthesis C-methylase UbiE
MTVSTIEYYKENSEALVRRYESADVSVIQQVILDVFTKGSHLLELGCGSGREASFLLANGYDVVAADGVASMLEGALELHPELDGRLSQLILPEPIVADSESFDGVYSIAVLMHLPKVQIETCIKDIYRVLKVGGRFLFSVSLYRDDTNDQDFDQKGRLFTSMPSEEWQRLCSTIGFKVQSVSTNGDGLGRGGIEWLNCVVVK